MLTASFQNLMRTEHLEVPAHSLLFSKSSKGAARFNVPIRRANRYQQYYMPSQHT